MVGCVLFCCLFGLPVQGQTDSSQFLSGRPIITASTASPGYCITPHNICKVFGGVTNFGRLSFGNESFYFDCFTGAKIRDCPYPKGTNTVYLYKGGTCVGGIISDDTLVSTSEAYHN